MINKLIISICLIIILCPLGTMALSSIETIDVQKDTAFRLNKIDIRANKSDTAPAILIGRALKVGLGIMGAIALAFYIWGGVVFMTAAGEAAKLESASNIYIWTTLGIVAILSSYVLTSFLFDKVIANNPSVPVQYTPDSSEVTV